MSILSLASGVGALVFAMFSVIPLVGLFCFGPFSALFALLALITGLVSVVRTTRNPELDGRQQAIMGIVFSVVWCLIAGILVLSVTRNQ